MEKPKQADKVVEKRGSAVLENETRFVNQMRQEIYRLTDYDIEPGDSIYPLLACLELLAKGCVNVLRNEDKKDWERMEKAICKALEARSGRPGQSKSRLWLICGTCVLGGIIIGMALGYLLKCAGGGI